MGKMFDGDTRPQGASEAQAGFRTQEFVIPRPMLPSTDQTASQLDSNPSTGTKNENMEAYHIITWEPALTEASGSFARIKFLTSMGVANIEHRSGFGHTQCQKIHLISVQLQITDAIHFHF